MASKSLSKVLAAIRDGRAAEVLEALATLHNKRPRDIFICYVFAYALEQAGKPERAVSMWKSALALQGARPRRDTLVQPAGIPFRHTPDLQQELYTILVENDDDDPIQTLIMRLKTAVPSDALPLDEDKFDDIEPEEEEEQTLVSETLGRILIAQEKYVEAASVYRTLAEQYPDHRERLLAEASRLRNLAFNRSEP